MSSPSFRLGLAQITSTDRSAANLELVEALYRQAAAEQADLAVFPENSLYFRIRNDDSITGLRLDGPELQRLRALVDQLGCPLMLTTPVEKENENQGGKLFNSTLLLYPRSVVQTLYTKIHLFDVDVAGAPPVRESDHFANGDVPRIHEVKGWKFGMSICYDLRFSELYSRYAQQADVILVPAAFLVPTGEAHWQVLLRARAIENQCFVAAPAQSGEHVSQGQVRKTYGHAQVIDPWGRVLAELTESPRMQVVELKRELIDKVRAQIPMRQHRRL